ncbi:MAG: hypothetical protein WC496_04185 [Phycisphaerae bacterium]|jgi:type II secretory pathway pseudopilin PulG
MSSDSEKSSFSGPIFSRKKSLLTVQQYATSQGVSTGVVQECAKLGVVQVRKHKDRTYIVDLPLDVYKNARQDDDHKPEPIDTAAQVQRISGLVNKIFQPQIPLLPSERQVNKENIVAKPVAIPDLNFFAQEESRAAATSRVNKVAPEISQFRISTGRKFTDAVKTTSAWKIVSVAATIALVISIAAYTWSSMDRKLQQQKLNLAYANINNLLSEYESSRQKAKLYELDSMNWQSEAQRNQKAFADLQTEFQQTREKLLQTQKSLSATQQYNVETLKKLNEQIAEITTRIQQTPAR